MCFTLKFYFILLDFFLKNMLVTAHLILSWPANGWQPMVYKQQQQQQNSPNKQVYHLKSRAQTKSSVGVCCAFRVDQNLVTQKQEQGLLLSLQLLIAPSTREAFPPIFHLPTSFQDPFFLPRILETHYKLVFLTGRRRRNVVNRNVPLSIFL